MKTRNLVLGILSCLFGVNLSQTIRIRNVSLKYPPQNMSFTIEVSALRNSSQGMIYQYKKGNHSELLNASNEPAKNLTNISDCNIHFMIVKRKQRERDRILPWAQIAGKDAPPGEIKVVKKGTIKAHRFRPILFHVSDIPESEWGYQLLAAHCIEANVTSFILPSTCASNIEGVRRQATWNFEMNVSIPVSSHSAMSFPNSITEKIRSYLYIFGGESDGGYLTNPQPFEDISTYKPYDKYSKSSRENGENPLRNRIAFASVPLDFGDGNLWLLFLGGYNETHGILQNIDAFDLKGSQWIDLNDDYFRTNLGRYSATASFWASGENIFVYIIGGVTSDGSALSDIEVIKFPKHEKHLHRTPGSGWKNIPAKSCVPRVSSGSIVYSNFMYLFGGQMALNGEVERCSLKNGCDVLQKLKPMLVPRHSFAYVFSSELHEILIIGGFKVGQQCSHSECQNDVNSITGAVEGFHIKSLSWIERPPLRLPRFLISAAEIAKGDYHREIFVVGGIGGAGPTRTSVVESFQCKTGNARKDLLIFQNMYLLSACWLFLWFIK